MKPGAIVGIGALLGLTGLGFWLYSQYSKLMDYTWKIRGYHLNSLGLDKGDINLYLDFTNKSNLKFTIDTNVTDVYMNGKFLTTIKNYSPITIEPNSTTTIGLNVVFNTGDALKVVGNNFQDIIAKSPNVKVKMDILLNVTLYGIPFKIPIVVDTNLHDMTS